MPIEPACPLLKPPLSKWAYLRMLASFVLRIVHPGRRYDVPWARAAAMTAPLDFSSGDRRAAANRARGRKVVAGLPAPTVPNGNQRYQP